MTESWAIRQARLTTAWKGLSALMAGEDFDEEAVLAAEIAANEAIEAKVEAERAARTSTP